MCKGDKLIRVDKNGTQHWESNVCERCGGSGYIDCYKYVEGGICFECGGTGISRTRKWRIYTEEYRKMLDERNAKRQEKKLQERKAQAPYRNAVFFDKMGLAVDGSAYVVMGDTYERRNELKEAGARFMPRIGWYFANNVDGFDTRLFGIESFGKVDACDRWEIMFNGVLAEPIKKAQEEYIKENSNSEYVGEVGDKISIVATVDHCACFDTQFGRMRIYTFIDSDNNVFVWKTSTATFLGDGQKVQLSGKIKEHNEYRVIKQNVMTRCKVA